MTTASHGVGRPSILHVVRQFHPNRGGLEDFVANLAREQVRLGCDVRVLTLDRLFSRPGERLPAQDDFDGIPIRRLAFRGSSRYPLAPSFLAHLGGAEVVHVHGIDFFFDAFAATKPLHRRRLVATTHGGFFHTPDHARLKRLWFNGPTRLSARAYDAIVGCSRNDARQFAEILPRPIPVIENGVDLAKFGGAASSVPRKTLITIGRFSKNKRLDRLLAMMAALVRLDPAWRLHIVGAASDWSRERLDAEIAGAGLGAAVTVHGGLDDAGVAALMGEASVFVSASEYEGFGIALVEAMSAGLIPVVHPNPSFRDFSLKHAAIALGDFAQPEEVAHTVVARFEAACRSEFRPHAASLGDYAWGGVATRYLALYAAVRSPAREALDGVVAPLGVGDGAV